MAEAASTQKIYPHKPEDVTYEKEIVDAIKKLPLEQRLQAIALNHYILHRKQFDSESEEQMQEIIRKYNKVTAPITDELNKIISGNRAPTQEEVQDGLTHLNDEEKAKVGESLTAEAISDYWFKVLTTCVRLGEDIFNEDHELLKKITGIEHIPEEANDDFTIKFTFAPNDYFENESLSVKFYMIDDNQPGRSEGTEIKWKEGKDITKKTVEKKQKNKKTGKTRTITKTVDADSFFTFFKTITPEGGDKEDEDEEGGDEESERLEINYSIAATFQEEIIPFHLEYYLGLRHGDEDMGDEDLEGIDEEDEDDDEDDDEEDTRKGRGKGKAPKGGAGAGAGGEPKQECKQQ